MTMSFLIAWNSFFKLSNDKKQENPQSSSWLQNVCLIRRTNAGFPVLQSKILSSATAGQDQIATISILHCKKKPRKRVPCSSYRDQAKIFQDELLTLYWADLISGSIVLKFSILSWKVAETLDSSVWPNCLKFKELFWSCFIASGLPVGLISLLLSLSISIIAAVLQKVFVKYWKTSKNQALWSINFSKVSEVVK